MDFPAGITSYALAYKDFRYQYRFFTPPIAPGNWQARYYDDSINPDDANPTKYHDVGKNRFLHAAASLQKLHQDLPRQQADLLVNQLSIFHANVTVTHEKLQEVGQGLLLQARSQHFEIAAARHSILLPPIPQGDP